MLNLDDNNLNLMSYLSKGPQVYDYANNGLSTGQNPNFSYTNPAYNPSTFNSYKPNSNYGRYGESQVNQIYTPINNQANLASNNVNPNIVFKKNSNLGSNYAPQNVVFNHSQTSPIVEVKPIVINNNQTIHQAQTNNSSIKFENYPQNTPSNYKYNLFSAIDQPWNRCLDHQKCNGCPSNQIIASQTFRTNWK